MRNITIALIVVIGVLGGFYSGWKYSQSKVPASGTPVAATQTGGGGNGFGGGGFGGGVTGTSGAGGGSGARGAGGFGGGTSGQVVSFANGVLTIKDRNGKDVKVNLSGQTPILTTADGSTSDLTPGTTVTVVGSTGSDGSVDARAVTIGAGR